MSTIKKLIKIFVIAIASLILLFYGLTLPVWPSRAKLCRDVEKYLPQEECLRQEHAVRIVQLAFPKGKVSSNDVKGALGEYLHDEYPTKYGHIEEYYLSVKPINYLLRNSLSYRFAYDKHGVLVALSYDD